MLAPVGGLCRRLDSPRLGMSTVRRAQTANPLLCAKDGNNTDSGNEFVLFLPEIISDLLSVSNKTLRIMLFLRHSVTLFLADVNGGKMVAENTH